MENIKDLLSEITDEFCEEQLKEIIENPKYHAEAMSLIDDCSPPLQKFLLELCKIMGIRSVTGANVLLSMLIRFEARQESLKKERHGQ